MPADDLTSIPDLQDKHRRVLADALQITTLSALAAADRRAIHQALRNFRPRPTLEQVARWQDHARNVLGEAPGQEPEWHPAASFAIVFAQRRVGDGWERRLEAERTEVEPEQERRIWAGWDCGEICAWMRGQFGLPNDAKPRPEAGASGDAVAASAQPEARAGGHRERARIRIDNVAVIDSTSRVDVPAADAAGDSAPLAALTGPLRVEVTVSGAGSGQEIHAVARILPEGAPGWNPQDPVVVKGAGRASFDLSRLPAGRHAVTLAAWAPDGTAMPAVVGLPGLIIQPGA